MRGVLASDIFAPSGGGYSPVGPRRRQRGFTMVELIITVSIAAVLLALAVPSFRNITLASKLATTSNDVVAAINTARMEAIRRNAPTQLCSDSSSANTNDVLGAACGTAVGAVYVLVDGNAEPVRSNTIGITMPIQLTGNVTAVRFTGQGLARAIGSSSLYAGTVADICTSSLSKDNHRVVAMVAGGSVITTTTTTATCP